MFASKAATCGGSSRLGQHHLRPNAYLDKEQAPARDAVDAGCGDAQQNGRGRQALGLRARTGDGGLADFLGGATRGLRVNDSARFTASGRSAD